MTRWTPLSPTKRRKPQTLLPSHPAVDGLTYDENAFKAEPAANRPITLSYGGGSFCTSPMAVAYYLGYYEDESILPTA